MIYVFVPYYNEDTPEFKESLAKQTVPYRLIKRNTKASKILWTEAVNDFWREVKRLNTKDDDVICIMNNDIEFGENLFEIALRDTKKHKLYIPLGSQGYMDFKNKRFINDTLRFNTFIGRCFFMTVKGFKESGGFCKLLPHALSDIDFGLRMIKTSSWCVSYSISHLGHSYKPVSNWSWLSYKNPIVWTIFLLRHPNRYTFINILKAWYDIIK